MTSRKADDAKGGTMRLGAYAATLSEGSQVSDIYGGITIEEEAETGTVISGRLLTIGTELQEGKIAEDAAIAEARALIEQATAPGAGRSATEPAGQSAY